MRVPTCADSDENVTPSHPAIARSAAYFAAPPTATYRRARRRLQWHTAMKAPVRGTIGAIRFRRITRSSRTRRNEVHRRIADVLHEFSVIPDVREDVLLVMLQIKQLRLILDGMDTIRMHLAVRGEGVVTAADIVAPPEVQIINPDLYLFTADNAKTRLDIEFMVERGRGYSPAGDRSGKLPIGELPVDAIYTPVRRVNWEVDSARVAQSTNYDKLVMEIWTDGTVRPEEAMRTSAGILIEHPPVSRLPNHHLSNIFRAAAFTYRRPLIGFMST